MLLLNAQPPHDCGLVAVSTAGGTPRFLLATEGAITCFAAAGAAADAATGAVRLLWRHRIAGGRVLHVAALEPDGSAYLLVTSPGPRAAPQAAVVVVSGEGGGAGRPGAAPAPSWPATPRQAVAAQVALGAEDHTPDAVPAVPVFSNLEPCGGGGFVLAACVAAGSMHLLRARRTAGGSWQLEAAATQLGNRLTTDPGATIVVESLSLSPASQHLAPAGGGPCLQAAILYCSHWLGGGVRVKHVASLEVEGTAVHSCCWFLRNVDPATSLVAALPGARTLVAAPDRLTLMRHDAVQERQVLLMRPMGRPTCAAALSQRLVVVGGAAGRLLLLDLEDSTATAGPVLTAPASCLAFLPAETAAAPAGPGGAAPGSAASAAGTPEGLLFVGSASGGSALLQLPAWQAAALGDAAQLAASVAPISSASLYYDDCGDPRLLACTGQPPHARLALGRLGAALHPLASGGDDLPGLVRLVGVKPSPGAASHRYLLLSCDAGAAPGAEDGWTLVLEAAGGELRAAELPGLQLEAATLLASALQGGCMLQVTQQAAHVFRPGAAGAPLSSWAPPGGGQVSLAALQGQYLALACGSAVQVLYCGGTGRLLEECQVALPQQASALALFQLGDDQEGGAEVWLAAGLWVSNEVLLQPLAADHPACRLQLGACQPRSLAVLPAGGSTFLVVGASSGELLLWRIQLQRGEFGGSSGVQLEEHGWVRAGVAPVSLHLLPGPTAGSGACGARAAAGSSSSLSLVAVSDQALLLAPDPVRPARLITARLHGGQALSAACPLVSAELPGSRLAYVQGGQLHIGSLQPEVQVRWDELALPGAAAASAAAFLPASGAAAVACADADGSSSLRLVDPAALQQLLRLPMPAGCCITAMAAAQLPCSSCWEQQQPGGAGGDAAAGLAARQAPGCKQFLLVALGGTHGVPAAVSEAAEEGQAPPPAAAADSSQPWWRQQQPPPPPPPQQQQQQAGASQPRHGQPAARPELRVYEVRRRASHANSSSHASGHSQSHGSSHSHAAPLELVLHGACPLPTAAFSLAAVQPDGEPFDAWLAKAAEACSTGTGGVHGSAPAAAAGRQPPPPQRVLAAGCHDGTVRLYRVFVDDAGQEARHAVEAGLAAIAAAVEPLSLAEAEGGEAAQRPAAAFLAAGRGSGAGLWSQQVALQLIAKAPTCFEGLPIELAASGSTLYARDLLSSLTAYHVQPLAAGQPAALVPLAADLAGRHLDAAMPLGHGSILAATHGAGLLLLQRDAASERMRQVMARERWELARAMGGEAAEAAVAEAARGGGGEPRYTPVLREAAQLDVAASHRLPGGVAAVCAGLLGVPLRRMPDLPDSAGSCGAAAAEAEAAAAAATVVCTSGTVLSARLLTPEQHHTLWQLQRAAQDLPPLSHTLEVAAAHGDDDAPGRCVDGDALAAAFLQPAGRERLQRAATGEAAAAGQAILLELGVL